jgi:shikimate dehydrogenase
MDALGKRIPAIGGLYMLVAQAVKAAEYFMGKPLKDELYATVYRDVLASKENIVLTGMPGSGKSTIGAMLAKALGRECCDTDAEIVKKTGMSIPEIFEKCGNDGFRKIEAETVAELSNRLQGAVIATGGGVILRDDNVRALKRTGRIYFLNRKLENILPTDDRPLSRDRAALEARFRERYPRYLSTCDREIVMDEIPEHTVKAITEDFFQ